MYSMPLFDPPSRAAIYDLIDHTTFGTIVTSGPEGLVASHLAFMIARDRGPNGTLISHLARANGHASLIAQGAPSLVIFSGPHGYISSSWYPGRPQRDNAPTWNFAVVHCHGRPIPLDTEETAQHIRALVAHLEQGRPNPWRVEELGADGMARRLQRILGFEIPVERLEAKLKMGQDEPWSDTKAAIEHLERGTDPALAQMMREQNLGRQ